MDSNSSELISIILPIYNDEKYIIEMLNSIKNQTYRPIEIIIIDDNSSDNSVKLVNSIVDVLEKDDIVINLICNNNTNGLSNNINMGVKVANGRYIFLADHDDVWMNDKVQAQVEYLKNNTDVVCCFADRTVIDENGSIVIPSEYKYVNFHMTKANFNDFLNRRGRFSSNVMCFRKNEEIVKSVFPIDNRIIEHDFYIALLFSRYGKIGYIHNPLINYRIHSNNLSANYYGVIARDYKIFAKSHNYYKARIKKTVKCDKLLIEENYYAKFNEKINVMYRYRLRTRIKDIMPTILYYLFLKLMKVNAKK